MAQLIKLQDYISRYESNPFHYPTQFIRLKQENWKRLLELWELENEEVYKEQKEEENSKRFSWNPFSKNKVSHAEPKIERQLPYTKEQLTKYFLDKLFPFQLKWATSTISHVSYTDQAHQYDPILKYFLQQFPDIYLVMYDPIFHIKKAPIEGDTILISPIGIDIISIIQEEPEANIIVNDDRTWSIETKRKKKTILSPLISLKRTEQIVKSILHNYGLDFTINKVVLSQTTHFLYTTEPYNTVLIGKNEYEQWYAHKRHISSTLKSTQLKVVEALLRHCLTTSVRRPEWENDDDFITPLSFQDH